MGGQTCTKKISLARTDFWAGGRGSGQIIPLILGKIFDYSQICPEFAGGGSGQDPNGKGVWGQMAWTIWGIWAYCAGLGGRGK